MALIATAPGICARCRKLIAKGDSFNWGRERGKRVHVVCESNDVVSVAIESTREIVWSDLQLAVFKAICEGEGNFAVAAVAGSGKTTTIVEGAKRYAALFPDRQVRMVAFGAENSKELGEKLARINLPNLTSGTFHATWKQVWEKYIGRTYRGDAQITRFKVANIARQLIDEGKISRETAGEYLSGALRLVAQAKGAGMWVRDIIPMDDDTAWSIEWGRLIDRFEIEWSGDDPAEGVELARMLLAASIDDTSCIDFDDMLYLPALHELQGPEYSMVFIDEAQDFNALQRYLTARMVGENGRLIAVGDPYQAIFGFRGADFDSMDQIRAMFNCQDLALDISYRCPQAIVRWAQEVVPHIKAHEAAPEGSVTHLTSYSLAKFQAGDYIICRMNAPIITLAYRMIASGKLAKVLGRNIGDGLVSLIKKQKAVDLTDLEKQLDKYFSAELKRLYAKNDLAKAEVMEDKRECLDTIIGSLRSDERTVETLIRKIEGLFTDSPNGAVVLMTAHKCKGLEADRVFILDPHLMPSMRARTDEQKQQEANLLYVARTRAKKEAYTVSLRDIS